MDFNMLNSFGTENEEPPKKKLNKKKLIKIIAIVLAVWLVIVMIILYMKNPGVRNFFDKYIFRKEVYENNLSKIALTEEDTNHSYILDKNIVVLNGNTLNVFNKSGKKEHSLNVDISNPIFDANNKFLAIAEKGGHKIYVVSSNNVVWQKDIDGEIKDISINKNGYVSAIVSNTNDKSMVTVIDVNGNQLFSIHLAATYTVSTSLSDDNAYLAIGEASFTGTTVQSYIRILAIGDQSEKYRYKADAGKLIINLKYQEKNKLVCMYDDSVHVIENNNDKEIMTYSNKDTLFLDVNLSSNVARIEKISDGAVVSNSRIVFTNTSNNSTNTYELGGVPKAICSYKDVTAVNLGSEALFIRTSGWLCKRYKSSQEIQKIILSNNIAGIVYKNKIEIIKL